MDIHLSIQLSVFHLSIHLCTLQISLAESPEYWNLEFQQFEIFADNFLTFADDFNIFASKFINVANYLYHSYRAHYTFKEKI